MPFPSLTDQKGFSLLEIAIVMMISGIIFGTSLSLYRPLQIAQSNAITKQKLERVMNAVSTYALQQNVLPCPGIPGAISTDMIGHAPPSCFDGDNPAIWGIVPYITLGLAQSDVIDGAGHYMTYIVPKALTQAVGNMSTDGPMTGLFKGNFASNFCGNPSVTAEHLLSVNRSDQHVLEPNIAVALVAYGNDGHGAYSMSLNEPKLRHCPLGANDCKMLVTAAHDADCHDLSKSLDSLLGQSSHERENAVDHANCRSNSTIYLSAYSNQMGSNHFDDQIVYSTGPALINRLGMAGCSL